MSQRLYYNDSYLREFTAGVTDRSPDATTVYLDRTAFYPTSGGQPFDLGSLAGIAVMEVAEEEDGRIAHRLAEPLNGPEIVTGVVDWDRRFDHMQQHSGQHLLSAVFEEAYRLRTVSFHLGTESCTIDLEGSAVDNAMTQEVERRANALIAENRAISVRFEDAAEVEGLRKASQRQGTLRIVSIDGVDRSACGGTHVRATGEIGALLIRKLEKIRQSVRVEFLCGGRAIRRARADYEALSKVAQIFSAALDEVPGMVATQLEASRTAEKASRKLQMELAGYQGKELYHATAPGEDGLRRAIQRLDRGNLEELRALAQSFTGLPKSLFAATLSNPPSVLLATSADSDRDAGKILKAALAEAGGRGGGTARMAQGSVSNAAALDDLIGKVSA